MERLGMYTPSQSTDNQCKDKGHKYYEYKCRIFFDPSTELDENDFLIDHSEVDAVIMNCNPTGSCEGMHQKMMKAILNLFKKDGIKVLAIKVTIIPKYPEGMANLTYIYVTSPKYVGLVS